MFYLVAILGVHRKGFHYQRGLESVLWTSWREPGYLLDETSFAVRMIHTHTCPSAPATAPHMRVECLPSSLCMLPQGTPFGRRSGEGQLGGAVLQLPSCACFLTLHAR